MPAPRAALRLPPRPAQRWEEPRNHADWQDAYYDTYNYDQCPPGVANACRLTSGSGQKMMVVGESHAAMYIPMLTKLARRHNMALTGGLLPFCPWTRGMHYTGVGQDLLR